MTERQATFGYYSCLVMLGVGAAMLGVAALISTGWDDLDTLGGILISSGLCIAISAWMLMTARWKAAGWCVLAVGVAPLTITASIIVADHVPTSFVVSDNVVSIVRMASSLAVFVGVILLLPVVGTRERIIAWIAALMLIFATVLNSYGWRVLGDLRVFTLTVSGFLYCIVGLCLLWLAGSIFKMAKHRTHDNESTLPQRLHIDIACPRCGGRHGLKQGESACPGCRLQFRLEVEEQRCACGYLLVGLTAEACPECGREIPESLRWSAGEQAGDAAGSAGKAPPDRRAKDRGDT